jgi:hypothetical protein
MALTPWQRDAVRQHLGAPPRILGALGGPAAALRSAGGVGGGLSPKSRVIEQLVVGQLIAAVVPSCENIDASRTKLVGNRLRDVHVHVQAHRHSDDPFRAHSEKKWRAGGGGRLLDLFPLLRDLSIDLFLVVEIVRHGSVRLDPAQPGVLPAHLFGRPAMRKIIHGDLGHADSRDALEPGRLGAVLLDVRVSDIDCHAASVAGSF